MVTIYVNGTLDRLKRSIEKQLAGLSNKGKYKDGYAKALKFVLTEIEKEIKQKIDLDFID